MTKLLVWPAALTFALALFPHPASAGRKTSAVKQAPTITVQKAPKRRTKAFHHWRRMLALSLRTCDPGGDGGQTRLSVSIPPKGRPFVVVRGGSAKLRRCVRKVVLQSSPPRAKKKVVTRLRVSWLAARRRLLRALLRSQRGTTKLKALFGSSKGFNGGIGGIIGRKGVGVRIAGRSSGRWGSGKRGSARLAGLSHRSPKSRLEDRKRAEKARLKLLAKALRLPKARGPKAPWLRPAPASDTPFGSPPHATRAVGAKLAVVKLHYEQLTKPGKLEIWKRRHRHAIVDSRRGYRGVIRFPKNLAPQWFGLDIDNRVYVASHSGQLYRADTPADALAGRFKPVAKLHKVTRWHATGKILLAVSGGKLLRSTDQGKTFAVLPHPKDAKGVHQSALRADGLVAIITSHHDKRTLFTKLGTSPWTRTSFQAKRIWQAANTIYARSGCDVVLLARDGKTWFKGPKPSSRGWARMLAPQSIARRRAYRASGQLVPAPKAVRQRVVQTVSSALCLGSGSGSSGAFSGHTSPTATGCRRGLSQPARCLRGSALRGPLASVYAFYPIGDRHKSLLFVDHLEGALRATALPKGCALPQRLVPLPGAMMLHCDDGVTRTKVYIAGKQGIWHDQGVLASPARELRQVQIAEDGTLVLQACDFNKKRERAEGNGYLCSTAWIRRPVALKLGAKAWREVQQRDMLAYRALSGGKVLAIDRGDERGRTLRLFVDDGKRRRALGRAIKLDNAGNLSNLLFEDGRIFFRRRYGSKLILLRKGELAPWPKLP